MTKTYGVDTSHWEGVIEWPTVRQGPVRWNISKATEGTSFVDSQFAANKAGCQNVGMPWGAYHYFLPRYDPVAQARHFVRTVGPGCVRYVLDLEEADLGISAIIETGERCMGGGLLRFSLSPAKIRSKAELTDLDDLAGIFVDEVASLTGRFPLIYTGPAFWNANMPADSELPDLCGLWVAHWGVDEPTLPRGWRTYVMHQFSASGRVEGIPGVVDEDWFNGDNAAVLAYFENGHPYDPPPPELPERVQVTVSGLRLRSAAGTLAPVVGYANLNSIWRVTGAVLDSQGRTWYQSGPTVHMAGWLVRPV